MCYRNDSSQPPFFFLTSPCCLPDLSSLTWDQICAPCSGSMVSYPLDHEESPNLGVPLKRQILIQQVWMGPETLPVLRDFQGQPWATLRGGRGLAKVITQPGGLPGCGSRSVTREAVLLTTTFAVCPWQRYSACMRRRSSCEGWCMKSAWS